MKTSESDKIALILRKAEGATTEAERETFFRAAQMKASRAGLDLEVLRYENREEENKKASNPITKRFEMGAKGDRGAGAYSDLFWAIGEVNDVYCIASNVHVDAYGMPFDIDHTEAIFNVVLQQMVHDCIKYIEEGEWRGHASSVHDARRSFYHGYRNRIRSRLYQAKREAEAEAKQEYKDKGVNTALVLADKKQRVESYYWEDAKHYGYRKGSSGSSRAAKGAGDRAGQKARLKQSQEVGTNKAISG